MSVNIIEYPKVVVFDSSEDDVYLQQTILGAQNANWTPIVFNDIDYAFKELDEEVDALITGTGPINRGAKLINEGYYGFQILIDKADNLFIPRAILRGKTSMSRFLRPNTSDIEIHKYNVIEIPDKVTSWLGSLSMQ